MKRTDIIEEYWEEFLQDCHFSLVTHAADNTYERDKAEPTENNFWAWYMKNKMPHDSDRINDHLRQR
jgi:hypothetical protein